MTIKCLFEVMSDVRSTRNGRCHVIFGGQPKQGYERKITQVQPGPSLPRVLRRIFRPAPGPPFTSSPPFQLLVTLLPLDLPISQSSSPKSDSPNIEHSTRSNQIHSLEFPSVAAGIFLTSSSVENAQSWSINAAFPVYPIANLANHNLVFVYQIVPF